MKRDGIKQDKTRRSESRRYRTEQKGIEWNGTHNTTKRHERIRKIVCEKTKMCRYAHKIALARHNVAWEYYITRMSQQKDTWWTWLVTGDSSAPTAQHPHCGTLNRKTFQDNSFRYKSREYVVYKCRYEKAPNVAFLIKCILNQRNTLLTNGSHIGAYKHHTGH